MITIEQIERANSVNLPQFLMANGFDLKRVGSEYIWKDHDSLHIKDNGSGEPGKWFRFSENKGGDNIGFIQEYMGKSFKEAVEALNGESYDRTYTPSRSISQSLFRKKQGSFPLQKMPTASVRLRIFARPEVWIIT